MHREDRHRDLREGDHPLAALADRAGDLVLEADREARIVDQVEDRQVEQVAEVEVAGELVAAVGGQRAAVHVPAVRGDDAHRIAVEADEADDLVGAPERSDLEERALVGHQPDRAAHVEGGGALARNDGEQLLLAPVGGIGRVGRQHRRRLVDRWTAGRRGTACVIAAASSSRLGQVVDRAVAAVDAASRRGPPW